MIESEKELLDYLSKRPYDAIVVEGYDGVGKGRVLNLLSEFYGVIPYRPDYNLWQKHDHRHKDRWKISGFFWDVYSHFDIHLSSPLLFDRGVISGAVYNHDRSIVEDYKKILRNMRVLHILVCCDKNDYIRFQKIRNPEDTNIEEKWENSIRYTKEYIECFDSAGVEYIEYCNHFVSEEVEDMTMTCAGCGHYNYGFCRHPMINRNISSKHPRCLMSYEKETQDIMEEEENDKEMYSL